MCGRHSADASTYSASNTLTPIQPRTPQAAAILREGYRSVPTLTNTDPPVHTRARRLANVAFTPRMVAQLEGFIRDLAVRLIEERVRGGRAASVDIVRALTWELPALVIFKILGVPDADVPRVKAGVSNRLMFLFGHTDERTQTEVAEGMVAFWCFTEDLVRARTAIRATTSPASSFGQPMPRVSGWRRPRPRRSCSGCCWPATRRRPTC